MPFPRFLGPSGLDPGGKTGLSHRVHPQDVRGGEMGQRAEAAGKGRSVEGGLCLAGATLPALPGERGRHEQGDGDHLHLQKALRNAYFPKEQWRSLSLNILH